MNHKTRNRILAMAEKSGKTPEEAEEAVRLIERRDNIKKYGTDDPGPKTGKRVQCRRCGTSRPTPKAMDPHTMIARCFVCKGYIRHRYVNPEGRIDDDD